MIRITRELRCSLAGADLGEPVHNSWGGWPTGSGLGPFVRLRITVAGTVDPVTGYLCNISAIDRTARRRVIPHLCGRWSGAAPAGPPCERLLSESWLMLADHLPGTAKLVALEIVATPYLRYATEGASAMVSVTQSFEFSAAHRLYCDQLTDAENQRLFGKCAYPSGHGHNYVVEVTVSGEPDQRSGVVMRVDELERVVKERVIDVFDHRHLNQDIAEFATLNPSVENITRVIWNRLDGAFAPVRLACVRVYETPKTWAQYSGQ